MKVSKNKSQEGVSMLEVLIFITILSLIFLAVAFVTGISLKRSQFNQNKLLGTRYAEELEEWLRGEKEADWDTFYNSRAGVGAGHAYCFDDTIYDANNNISWPAAIEGCNSIYNLRGTFLREVTLTQSLGSQVNVQVSVSWVDGPNTFNIPINTILTKWE